MWFCAAIRTFVLMPLHDQLHPWALPCRLLVWARTEAADFFNTHLPLSEKEQEDLALRYPHPNARLDWMSSRYTLQQLCGQHCSRFYKDAAGKLRVPDTPLYFSISHSGTYTAAIQAPMPTGIDIQVPTPKLARIAHKYIATEVLDSIRDLPEYEDYLHYYWGIKEALFKAYGKGRVNYIEHLRLVPFEAKAEGRTWGMLYKPDEQQQFEVFYKKTEDYYLCAVCARPQ